MATLEQLGKALVNADKASDTVAATALAQEIKRMKASPDASADTQPEEKAPVEQPDTTASPLRTVDSFMRGAADTATFGTADELSGLASTIAKRSNPIQQNSMLDRATATVNLLNPLATIGRTVADYMTGDPEIDKAIEAERATQKERDVKDPVASTTGRIAGALINAGTLAGARAPFMAALPAKAGLLAKTAQGAKAGALYSGLYGLGTGEDGVDRLKEGAKSALTGGAIGGAIPAVTGVIGSATKPVRDALKGYFRPDAFANQKIVERLSDAGLTPDQAAAKMDRNSGLSLADVGGKTSQNLLKTTTNIPGPAAARVSTQLAQKAMQQGDRIRTAVRTMFADPDGYIVAKDRIASDAEAAAAPLFRKAQSIAIPYTKTLEDALNTPAGQQALRHAETLAGNEQKPFQQLFINMTSPTTGVVKRVPDVRAWEYIRQSFDDMIKAQKDPITKEITNEGRILVGLQNRIFNEVRAANPYYDSGLKIFRGAHTLEDAMKAGKEALAQSPQANQKIISAMSSAEKEAYKIGVANAIRDRVGKAGFTQNGLLKFFSNRDELANLKVAFDDPKQFAAFRKQMFAEARKRSTYNVVTGQSSTAKQLADMAEAGGLSDTVNFAKDATTGGITAATLKYLGSRMKMLGGFTPEVADRIAKKLMATNPQQVKNITVELAKIQNAAISADQKRQLVYRLITPAISDTAAHTTGQQP